MRKLLSAGVAALSSFACAAGAFAQTPAAAPSQTITLGPPIAGVCVISRNQVFRESAVGKSVIQRLNTLENQVEAELQPQATALRSEQQALQQATTQDAARANTFAQKANEFQRLQYQRSQEMEATKEKQIQRVMLEMQPVLLQIVQQKQCGLLLDGDGAALLANPAMDLTPSVIVGLNAKIQSITFDREVLSTQAAANAQ